MLYLPNEIINLILSFIGPTKSGKMIKYLIDHKYDRNYNPSYFNYYSNIFIFNYSFYEWYFLVIRYNFFKDKKKKYNLIIK